MIDFLEKILYTIYENRKIWYFIYTKLDKLLFKKEQSLMKNICKNNIKLHSLNVFSSERTVSPMINSNNPLCLSQGTTDYARGEKVKLKIHS